MFSIFNLSSNSFLPIFHCLFVVAFLSLWPILVLSLNEFGNSFGIILNARAKTSNASTIHWTVSASSFLLLLRKYILKITSNSAAKKKMKYKVFNVARRISTALCFVGPITANRKLLSSKPAIRATLTEMQFRLHCLRHLC